MPKMTGLNQFQNECLRTSTEKRHQDLSTYPECLQYAIRSLRLGGLPNERVYANQLLAIWDQMIFALGLAGESGEVCDLLKKKHGHGKEVKLDDLKKELGDVAWYQNVLSYRLGFTSEEVATANSEKLRVRHPDGFTVATANAKADEK